MSLAGVWPTDAACAHPCASITTSVSASMAPVSCSAAASNSPPANGSSITSVVGIGGASRARRCASTSANSRLIVAGDGRGIPSWRNISTASATVSCGLAARAACTTRRHARDTTGSRGVR